MKIIYTDYDEGYTIIELIGEWNDCLTNDVMFLKREIVDHLAMYGINKYIIICENVLNFHGSDDCYYEEWHEEVMEEGGWICFVNMLDHVLQEMKDTKIQHFVNMGGRFNEVSWRPQKPKTVFRAIEALIHNNVKQLTN